MKRSIRPRWRVAAGLLALAGIAVFASFAWAGSSSAGRAASLDDWHFLNNATINVGGFNNTIVGTVSVKAGTYIVLAKVSVNNSQQGDNFECRIQDFNGNLDDVEVETHQAFEHEGISLQGF